MNEKPLLPEDRAYLREVVQSVAGRRWIEQLVKMRPPISGATTESRGMSASEALGYEKAVFNLGLLLEDPPVQEKLKNISIRED